MTPSSRKPAYCGGGGGDGGGDGGGGGGGDGSFRALFQGLATGEKTLSAELGGGGGNDGDGGAGGGAGDGEAAIATTGGVSPPRRRRSLNRTRFVPRRMMSPLLKGVGPVTGWLFNRVPSFE
jgi:hypothetical protein